jgi:nitrogen regulatory protein PII
VKPCKRIEIVIEQTLARHMASRLDELGAPGYTLISGVSGRGDRGLRQADELTDTFTNCIFVIACDDDELVSRIIEGVRAVLVRSGGVCLVSDASWVRH